MSKSLSESFQVAGLIATILVIAIHYNSKIHIDNNMISGWNYLFQEFITNGIARIAVPYFAFAAGIFFFLSYRGLISYRKNIKKRVHSLLIPYLIGGVIVISGEIFLTNFVREGEYIFDPGMMMRDALLDPVSVQYWFLRDLLFLALFSPLIYGLVRYLGVLVVLALAAFWALNIDIMPRLANRPWMEIETLFFFSFGCYLVTRQENWQNLFRFNMASKITLVVFILLTVFRVYIDPTIRVGPHSQYASLASLLVYKACIVVGLHALISCSSRIVTPKLLYISCFTFFAFLYHLLPFSRVVTKIGNLLVADPYLFYFTFPFASVSIFLIAIFMNRYLEQLYNVISGARGPQKVLQRN